MNPTRENLSQIIHKRLLSTKNESKRQFRDSQKKIGYFILDDLLPQEMVQAIHASFPTAEKMMLKKSIRQDKYVASQMDQYDALLEEIIYAFQQEDVVKLIGEICGITAMQPDANLYAGGISLMGKNQFLNPHLDNSHDKDRNLWRVLNLLYYVTPDWETAHGGNLELWPNGLENAPITIPNTFNRLVVMATHQDAMHSVSPVVYDGYRQCISNYYFSEVPLRNSDRFHVTSFRARPGHFIKDSVLQADTWLRMKVRSIFKKGIVENPHVYKKKSDSSGH